MMLGSLRYDLQVEYEPGKNLLIADTLSRAPKRKALKLQPTQRMNLKYSSLKTFQSVKKKNGTVSRCYKKRPNIAEAQEHSDKWMARKEVSRRPRAT